MTDLDLNPRPKLAPEEYARLYFEYKTDPILFLCDAIKIPTPGGAKHFEPYREQIKLIDLLLSEHYVISLKSRQIGISTIVQAFIVWLITFYKDITVGVISKDGDEAVDFVKKILSIYDDLPFWLKKDFAKKREKSFILNNRSAVYAATVNPHKPSNIFRGKTLTFLAIDEAAFVEYIDEAFTAISPAMSTAHIVCEQRKIPYGCVIMSTPNGTTGIGQWFFNQWTDALAHTSRFKPIAIHWKQIPVFRNSPTWYKTQCEILKHKWRIDQELELKFTSPQNAVFTGEDVEYLQSLIREPVFKQELFDNTETLVDGCRYEVNENPIGSLWGWYDLETIAKLGKDESKRLAVTVDSATMFGSDKSVIEVFDIGNLDQIMEFVGKCRVDKLIDVIENIIMPLVPNALLVIELNNPGNQLIEYFTRKSKWGGNLYHHIVYDKKLNIKEKRPGLATTAKTRPLIIDSLFTCISEKIAHIKSERLVNELISLRYGRNNRIEGSPHDDIAMAFSFAAYIRQYCYDTAYDYAVLPSEQTDTLIDIVEENRNQTPIRSRNMFTQEDDTLLLEINEKTPKHIQVLNIAIPNSNKNNLLSDDDIDLIMDI
ncbi:MAG: hypothetical protein GXO10_04890 [Crenarchaeota archaeon]|nr:hypothetical protein [Thermoproteota archaeon]